MKASELIIPKRQAKPNLVIDLEPITGQKGAAIVLREPDVNTFFNASAAVFELKKTEPFWHDALLNSIAQLGECHVSPQMDADQHASRWYLNMAADNKDMFTYVLGKFQFAYPDKISFAKAVSDAKND